MSARAIRYEASSGKFSLTAAAAYCYLKLFPSRAGQPAPGWALALRRLSQNKFYVDEIYDWLVIRRVRQVGLILYKLVDELLIDTVAVRGSAWVTSRTGALLRYLQTGDAQSYAAVMALALVIGAAYLVLQVIR